MAERKWSKKRKILTSVAVLVLIGVIIDTVEVIQAATGHHNTASAILEDVSKNSQNAKSVATPSPKKATDETKATQRQKVTQQPKKAPLSTDDKLKAILVSLRKQYSSINDSYVYTTVKDGGGGLNQPGYYTNGAAFCDTPNTFYEPSDTLASGGSEKAYGFECGGVVQVYKTDADVAKQITFFQSQSGNPELKQCQVYKGQQVCDYKQVGHVLLHVSDKYTPEQQLGILNFLYTQVLKVSP